MFKIVGKFVGNIHDGKVPEVVGLQVGYGEVEGLAVTVGGCVGKAVEGLHVGISS